MTSFRTIQPARGRHASPEGDHPSCACPAVTAFLRAYNDRLDDARRQDLFALASDLVDSRRAEATTSDRVARLVGLAWRHRKRIGPLARYPHLAFAHASSAAPPPWAGWPAARGPCTRRSSPASPGCWPAPSGPTRAGRPARRGGVGLRPCDLPPYLAGV